MEVSRAIQYIRKNWAVSDAKRDAGLTTPKDILRSNNISYGPHGKDNLLDIYTKNDAADIQPTIVNVHGGAWVYGCKEVYQYYCMELALKGFTVVNINYRLAPENKFPAPLEDVNAVLRFIEKNNEKYHLDKDNIIVVGDSAGGQIVSQYAAVLTDPNYAKLFDFQLPNVKIKALALNCGIYDSKTLAIEGKEVDTFAEYTGKKNGPLSDKTLEQLDTMKHITDKFPPSYIMSCHHDFLLPQAKPMYKYLQNIGIPSVLKIYGSEDRPEISHVFHINCKLEEAKKCNDDECSFFRKFL